MLKSRAADRPATDESVEAVRRRARYRLVGALVLVLLGVVGFPLVFDTEPRPVERDLIIEIPDQNRVPALTVSPQAETSSSGVAAVASSASGAVASDRDAVSSSPAKPSQVQPLATAKTGSEAAAEAVRSPAAEAQKGEPAVAGEPKSQTPSDPKPQAKPLAKADAAAEAKPEPKPSPAVSRSDEAARARAILEGRTSAVKTEGQWVVQVGAYSDEASITRVRRMLEAGGLKTFTQAVPTQAGDVTRVRLGPYGTNDEALRAQAKAKTLGFSGAKVLKP